VIAGIGGSPTEVARIAVTDALTVGDFLGGIEIELNEPDMDTWNSIRVRIESGDLECNEDNNLLEIDGPFCQ
jgi:hypothetical protein